jgi:hypothetical protein
MIPKGFTEYQRRSYCKDIVCPIQVELDSLDESAASYERLRQICRTDCLHTTWEFHHWLIQNGYLVIRPD